MMGGPTAAEGCDGDAEKRTSREMWQFLGCFVLSPFGCPLFAVVLAYLRGFLAFATFFWVVLIGVASLLALRVLDDRRVHKCRGTAA